MLQFSEQFLITLLAWENVLHDPSLPDHQPFELRLTTIVFPELFRKKKNALFAEVYLTSQPYVFCVSLPRDHVEFFSTTCPLQGVTVKL